LWCLKLKGLDDAQIANGIERVEKQIARNAEKGEKSYPPSYAEFIGLANRKETPPASHKSWAGLPAPTMSIESRKEEMRKIMDMMRSNKT
jgi:hypothetical protein